MNQFFNRRKSVPEDLANGAAYDDPSWQFVQRELARIQERSVVEESNDQQLEERHQMEEADQKVLDELARYLGPQRQKVVKAKFGRKIAERVAAENQHFQATGPKIPAPSSQLASSETMEIAMRTLRDQIEHCVGGERRDAERRLAVIRNVYEKAYGCSASI
tara:strand:+ start:10087 stop:10572 length:486 start_codon:yes stop_codon:yes gene_type:complete